jgi:heme/copper-type cytochrome/quinol oxidase subunit 2
VRSQGPMAEEIARVWWILLVLGSIVFVAVLTFIFVALVQRHRSDTPPEDGALVPSRKLVHGGAVMPAIMVAPTT